MLRRFMKKRVLVALTVVGVLAAAGGAYAYFTSTGSTNATATVGTPGSWNISASPAAGPPLVPDVGIGGANVQTVPYTITNGGTGSQRLSNIAVSIQPASLPAGCSIGDFSVNGAPVGTTANDTSLAGTFTAGQQKPGSATIEMIDSGANQNACATAHPVLNISAS
jgi:hypothetical protein